MKKILVTGGAGFIGSHFIRYQLSNYSNVHIVNFDKLTYAGNLDNLKDIDFSRYTFIRGDVSDYNAIYNAMIGCDAVVNFAAETHVDRSILGASEFINTDVKGVYCIVDAAKKLGNVKVLLVSTDEVYGSIDKGSFKESDKILPRNPYSASKASGELIGMSYFHTFNVPVIITRATNTYGSHQYPEKVLPLFTTNAIDNQPLPLYKGGEHNVRDWLYVEDHCSGVDVALRFGTPGEIYNISGENEYPNIVLTKKILDLLGKDESLIKLVQDRPGHDYRYSIDSSKLKNLGWIQRMNWDKGIELTVRWYQENEWWWRKIKTGEYLEFYKRQYGQM